jgi:hypothetical protein
LTEAVADTHHEEKHGAGAVGEVAAQVGAVHVPGNPLDLPVELGAIHGDFNVELEVVAAPLVLNEF